MTQSIFWCPLSISAHDPCRHRPWESRCPERRGEEAEFGEQDVSVMEHLGLEHAGEWGRGGVIS